MVQQESNRKPDNLNQDNAWHAAGVVDDLVKDLLFFDGPSSVVTSSFAKRWVWELNPEQIDGLQDDLVSRVKEYLPEMAEVVKREPEFSDLGDFVGLARWLLYAANDLEYIRLERLGGSSADFNEISERQYRYRTLEVVMHDLTRFVNSFMGGVGSMDEAERAIYEEIRQRVLAGIQTATEYFQDIDSYQALLSKEKLATLGMEESSVGGVVNKLELDVCGQELPFRLVVESESWDGKKLVPGSGMGLYSVVRNMVGNGLEEQMLYDHHQIEVRMSMPGGETLRIDCVNRGGFPQEWLDEKGHVTTLGKTTKANGSGMGLKIINDYALAVGGELTVTNSGGFVTVTLSVPLVS